MLMFSGVAVIIAAVPGIYLNKVFWLSAKVTLNQPVFYTILLFVPLLTIFVSKSKKIQTSIDWWAAVPVWSIMLFVCYTTAVYYFSGIDDKSIINAQVLRGTWEESYTAIRLETVCASRDKDGKCTSSYIVSHCDNKKPDSFSVQFSDGSTHSFSKSNYRALVREFGNEKQMPVHRLGQCSRGDGRRFVTQFVVGKSNELFASYEIPVVNYLLAGKNLYSVSSEVAKSYADLLKPVPGITEHPSGIGPFKSDRVIVAAPGVPYEWQEAVETRLNAFNGKFGPSKEINLVLYIVATANREFVNALDAHWVHGRKNQLTIVVGSTEYPRVDWVDVIDFWSERPEVRIALRDSIQNMALNSAEFLPTLETEVLKGWERKRMRTFEYLSWELSLPWWMYLVVTAIAALIAVAAGRMANSVFDSYHFSKWRTRHE